MKKTSSPLRTLARLPSSVAKRALWRRHLVEAQTELRRLLRELPTVEMMLAIPQVFQGKGYYRSLESKQNLMELLGLVSALRCQPLHRVCEIGTFRGGTLFVWCQLAAPDAQIISVDLPGGQFGGGYNEKSLPLFQSFCQPGQRLDCIRGSSHDAKVREVFRRALNGTELDFLFIDGDHSYVGVKRDFEFYSQFVRRGGLVAFHDICRRIQKPGIEVHKLWAELKTRFRHEEFIETGTERRKIGIGLLHKD